MRTYTAEEKAQALALYVEHGPHEASRRNGVPVRTISRWASEVGVSTEVVAKTQAATEAAAARNAERKTLIAENLWEIAHLGTDRILELLPDADLRDVVGAVGQSVKYASLLTGEPTDRTENVDRGALIEEARERGHHLRAV